MIHKSFMFTQYLIPKEEEEGPNEAMTTRGGVSNLTHSLTWHLALTGRNGHMPEQKIQISITTGDSPSLKGQEASCC